ncbi:MAG: penicillin-binding protein 2 [Verrucomicrobia bacterium]|nr:penicillin-binding protein 2 [Verrucomicrobiota bacterium]
MAEKSTERSGGLVESHKGYDSRTIFFYFAVAALLTALTSGLAYQQLFKTDEYHEKEKQQNQRRILVPGPRGNIYDREGRLLVGNRPRFAVTLHLDSLRKEFRKEYIKVRKAYRELEDKDIPNSTQLAQIARYSVVQRYLDQVNASLGRSEKLDAKDLNRHFHGELLLPYSLVDDLKPEEYARLIEQLPVSSPLQVYASSTRYYPFGSAASHVLGYVSANEEPDSEETYTDNKLATFNDKNTFKMRGTIGRDGIESEYDNLLQGETGGTVYRVDPAGYRAETLYRHVPIQGKSITTSIDIDLQIAAETALDKNRSEDDTVVLKSAAVVIDINTGEILALASNPDYDLNDFAPRLSTEKAKVITDNEAWMNRAISGAYPPGSTFKILTAVAGLHNGWLTPNSHFDCEGHIVVGRSDFPCHNRHVHGNIGIRDAIAKSCNVFFIHYGSQTGGEALAAEARRFHLDRPMGIELPHETRRMMIPDEVWKKKERGESWYPGDTANMAIGQGFVLVTPLQMASFTASIARGEVFTQPTLEHQTNRTRQRTEPIGFSREQAAALRDGMEECIKTGTGKTLRINFKHPEIRVAGKSGTAQKRTAKGTINYAWFISYAPAEKPEIAIAVMVEGDKADEEYGGGTYAAPVTGSILQEYFDKKSAAKPGTIAQPPKPATSPAR